MQLSEESNDMLLRRQLLNRAIHNFKKLSFDPNIIDILPENLPPKPWYLGGEWNQYGFMKEEDMIEFCDTFGLKMTFDICHAQLYCKSCNHSLTQYAQKIKNYVSHMHISDANGINGEGIQIGDGELDFESVFSVMNDVDCSWVTEIWAGHTNNNQGLYKSMKKLLKYRKYL